MSLAEQLIAKFQSRQASIAVIGMGYVGLPLAVQKARAGFRVFGIEWNPERVSKINQGISYIEDVSSADVRAMVQAGRLSSTSDFDPIAGTDVITICVPTPLTKHKEPDTSFIESVTEQSLPYIHRGQLVVLESTTYPGTTEEIIQPKLQSRGFTVGEDIFLAFCPERIDPGNQEYRTYNTPRVVGGVTPTCTKVAKALYDQIISGGVYPLSSPKAAEMTKLLENAFRIVNISLVNELATLCDRMGINIWEVIEAAKTKPFGFMPFYPGPGLGGHCIPVDPVYLSWKAREFDFTTRFIDLAGQINDAMPYYVVERCSELLNRKGKAVKGSRVLQLGMAYKRDVADIRESPALKIAGMLLHRGAHVTYHDPYVPQVTVDGLLLSSTPLSAELLRQSELVVVATDHSPVDYPMVVEQATLIYDTRNVLKEFTASHIHGLGRGDIT